MTKSIVVIIVLLVAAIGTVALLGASGERSGTALDPFAQCLAAKGATMYGASWCSHCQNQRAMFGGSFKYVPHVECDREPARCVSAGIQGTPMWTFADGTRLLGEQSLERLAEASGCTLPENR